MSLIRCLSNPEKLYVWGGESNYNFCFNESDSIQIPYKEFAAIVKHFNEDFLDETPVIVGEFSLYEDPETFKVILKHKDVSLEMWHVTWAYIVNNYNLDQEYNRLCNRMKRKALLLYWDIKDFLKNFM